ncbi:MAG: hypothetical protein AB7F89_01985 [Pirellulaceae bacterium]
MSQTIDTLPVASAAQDNPGQLGKPLRPACPNCQSPDYGRESWCQACGYYAVLGRCIELDDSERQTAAAVEPTEPAVVTPPLGVPAWAWQLAGAMLGAVGLALAGRAYTTVGSPERLLWSAGQAGGGLALVLGSYATIAYAAMKRDSSVELMDVLSSPMRIWVQAMMDFQRSSHRLSIAFGGLWSIIAAHVLLGVPYGELVRFESTPAPPKKEPPAGAMAAPANSGSSSLTMEEAMGELANKSGAGKLSANAAASANRHTASASDPAAQNQSDSTVELECRIVGYVGGSAGGEDVESLVIALPEAGTLRVVGTVSRGLTSQTATQFLGSAQGLRRPTPAVTCSYSAIWLEPTLRCRVTARPGDRPGEYIGLTLISL